jgi:hypothetical protein
MEETEMLVLSSYTVGIQSATRIDRPVIPGMHNHLLSRNHIIDLSSLGHIEIHQINCERKTRVYHNDMLLLIFVEKPELL